MDDDALDGILWKSSPAISFALDPKKEGDVLVAFARMDVVDRDAHLTERGAFPSGKAVPISAYGHTSWPDKGARLPVGRGEISEDGDVAKMAGRFFVDTTHGKDAYLTVRGLAELQEWSYGYRILDRKADKVDGKSILRLKKLDVYEVSPTLVGAGIGTSTLGIKSDDEGPLAGLPYADHFERVLLDVGGIVARAKSLRELRVKDGRELSEANRARLLRLRDAIVAIEETKAEVEDLLARTERANPEAKAAALRLFAEYEAIVAGLNGVPLPVPTIVTTGG